LSRDEFVAGFENQPRDERPRRGDNDRPGRGRGEGDRPEGARPDGDRPERRGFRPDREGGPRRFGREGDRPGPGGPPEGRGPMRGGPGMIGFALVRVLDVNHDGTLDAEEIAGATEALKKLDRDGNGEITREELMPLPGGPRDGRSPRGDRPEGG